MQPESDKLLHRAEDEVDRRLRARGLRTDTWREHPYHADLVDALKYEDFEGAVQEAVDAIESAATLQMTAIDRTRPRSRRSEDPSFVSPPADWDARSSESLSKFEARAETVRKALTRSTAHLSPTDACALLRDLDEGAREGSGDSLTLPLLEWFDYGDGSGRFVTVGMFQAFRGYEPDFNDEEVMSRTVTPAFSLGALTDVMMRYTGCRIEEAVGFILAGVTFTLPWVQITRVPMRGTNAFGLVRYEIVVGSPDVPGEDIRKAYIAFRKNHDPESANRRPRRRVERR